MKKELTSAELEKRLSEIDAREPEEMTPEDLAAFAAAETEDPGETVTLAAYKEQKEYSGKLMLRVPKELHKELAEKAAENGVSLNQYALYKLAR